MTMRAPSEIDELDRKLIDILSQDARLSNRRIANELGVTEGTVRGRIKKLQQDRLIAFTAVTSPDIQDENQLAFIGVQADLERVRDLADDIAALPNVNGVLVTMGRFNIFAICLFDTLETLHAVASETILAMPGVHHVETSIAVKTVKYDTRIVRITDNDHARDVDTL